MATWPMAEIAFDVAARRVSNPEAESHGGWRAVADPPSCCGAPFQALIRKWGEVRAVGTRVVMPAVRWSHEVRIGAGSNQAAGARVTV